MRSERCTIRFSAVPLRMGTNVTQLHADKACDLAISVRLTVVVASQLSLVERCLTKSFPSREASQGRESTYQGPRAGADIDAAIVFRIKRAQKRVKKETEMVGSKCNCVQGENEAGVSERVKVYP